MPPINQRGSGVRINIYVQPRASRTEVVGEHGDAIKLRIAAPPVDGAANEEVVSFLAKALGVAGSRITLVSGHTGRRKVIDIDDVKIDVVQRVLMP